jgi:hypothetical protein
MQHAFQLIEGAATATLPLLATASDAREVVQLLRKRPEGITIVEASDAIKKRLFDPRKIAAYETWRILTKSTDRMKLSELGLEFAAMLEPEARFYRLMLDNTPPYRAVLEFIHRQDLDLVTCADIIEYWEEQFPEVLEQGDKTLEGQVVSFLHLCHAGEIGSATVGRKGQPSRLRVDHDELALYIEGSHRVVVEQASPENIGQSRQRRPTLNVADRKNLRVCISTKTESQVVRSIRDICELTDIDYEVVHRELDDNKLPARTFEAMRRCDAGVILLSPDDYYHQNGTGNHMLNQATLIEIGAASLHLARRLVVLRNKQIALPFGTNDFCDFEFEGDELTWETGLRLAREIKRFKTSSTN